MKKSFEVYRRILIEIADGLPLSESPETLVHIRWMADDALIDAILHSNADGQTIGATVLCMKSRGVDMLSLMRNDVIWHRFQNQVSRLSGAASTDLAFRMLEEHARAIAMAA